MSTTTVQISSGLARILSNEPLPRVPSGIGNDLDEYIRNLHIYLQRLAGSFTAKAIIDTLGQEPSGSAAFVKVIDVYYKYKGTNDVTLTLDSSIDWRGHDVISFARGAVVRTELIDLTVPTGGADNNFIGAPQWSTYSITDFTVDGVTAALFADATTGALKLSFDNSPGTSKTLYTHFYIAAVVKTKTLVGDFTNAGNQA